MRFAQSSLIPVRASDYLATIGAAVALAMTALFATGSAARQNARVGPTIALKTGS